MERKTSIEKNKGEGIKLENNLTVIVIAIILITAVVILWGIYGQHYVWVPLESTLEAGV